MINAKTVAFAYFLVGVAGQSWAGPMTAVDLPAMTLETAILTVVDQEGAETQYTPAQLEDFATYSLTTTTPWREEPALFEGVLLSDILAASHLETAASILVTAENDYQTTISKEVIDSVAILVATRVDGMPLSRRARGPIQFVIDAEAFANSPLTTEATLVWMAARIESAD